MQVKITAAAALLLLNLAAPSRSGEPPGAYNEALKLHRAGKLKEAVAAYDKAIKADPRRAEAFVGRGEAYAKLGQPERAIKDQDEAIKLNPKLAEAYYIRGSA
jgi:tetratricopeptide (TPR) repeat protein